MRVHSKQSKRGFTLIELMVAISIVAILAAVGAITYSSTQVIARDAKRKGDLKSISGAIYLLQTTRGGWCTAGYGCPWGSTADHPTWGMVSSGWNSMETILIDNGYLQAPVKDPKCPSTGVCTGWGDYYLQVTANDIFVISARLEGIPAGTGSGCAAGYNYCITQ